MGIYLNSRGRGWLWMYVYNFSSSTSHLYSSIHLQLYPSVTENTDFQAYVWLHKGAFGCAEDIVKGKKTTKYVYYITSWAEC